MKICFVVLEAAPLNGRDLFLGGTVNNVVTLSKGLAARGHEIHLFTSDVTRRSRKDIKTPWGVIHPIPVQGPYGSLTYSLEVLTKLVQKVVRSNSLDRFDVIDVHSGYSSMNVLAYLISLATHVPVVFTLYSSAEWRVHGKPYERLFGLARRIFSSRIRKIIVISEEIKKNLKKRGIPSRNIVHIPPTFDPQKFSPSFSMSKAKKEMGLNNDCSYILYIGSWNPSKGVETLIEGVEGVLTDFPRLKLVLAFGGVEQNDQRKIAIRNLIIKKGLESKVVELGLVCETGKLMASSTIVVVPYLNTRGIADRPLTVIEAMACGRPVVATRVGAVSEIIKNYVNGILVKPGRSAEIDRSLRHLLKNPKEADMIGTRAAECINRTHGIDQVVGLLEEVYEELQ